MYKQVDPLPIGERFYYKSERVQIIDYHQPDRTFARQYVIASLVTGEIRRVFRNELLQRPIYPPSSPTPDNAEQQLQLILSEEMDDIPTESTQTERFATSSEENLRELENARMEATTVKQTTWAVKLFKGTTSNFTVHNTYQTHPIIL